RAPCGSADEITLPPGIDAWSQRSLSGRSSLRFPERCVQDGPEMDRPPEQKEPEHGGEAELQDGSEETALKQLAQSRDKETAQRCNHVAGGTLARHGRSSWIWVATIVSPSCKDL